MEHTLDLAAFRAAFPQFKSEVLYPDATIEMWWDIAACSLPTVDTCRLHGKCLQTALNLMTAHIGALWGMAAAGRNTVGIKSSATIDKVSVTVTVPPFKDGWQFWLSQTPYGLQLWAMLSVKSAGGFYVGGRPEGRAFRKVGGSFR